MRRPDATGVVARDNERVVDTRLTGDGGEFLLRPCETGLLLLMVGRMDVGILERVFVVLMGLGFTPAASNDDILLLV